MVLLLFFLLQTNSFIRVYFCQIGRVISRAVDCAGFDNVYSGIELSGWCTSRTDLYAQLGRGLGATKLPAANVKQNAMTEQEERSFICIHRSAPPS